MRLSACTARRCALGFCLALLIGLLVSYASLLRQGNAGMKQTDFVPYYSASHLLLQGHGGQIYDFHTLGRLEASLVYPLQVKSGVMPYLYPPFFALALAPLATLPYSASYVLWLLVNLALLALVLLGLQRYACLAGSNALLLWLAALSFLPLFVALAQGQTSAFLLAILSATLFAARGDRWGVAGMMLAFALVKPPYAVPFLLVFLMQRRWRAVVVFGATSLLLLALPIPVLGPGATRGYLHTLVSASSWRTQIGGFEAQFNHSFAGFAQLLLTGPEATVLYVVLSLVALILLVQCALRSDTIDVPFGMATIVALLISPHVLVHDLTLLLIPVAIVLRWRGRNVRQTAVVIILGYAAILVGLRLAEVVPLQASVLAMSGLGMWLFSLAVRPRSRQGVATLQLMPSAVTEDFVR
jgi:hypothetical protein